MSSTVRTTVRGTLACTTVRGTLACTDAEYAYAFDGDDFLAAALELKDDCEATTRNAFPTPKPQASVSPNDRAGR